MNHTNILALAIPLFLLAMAAEIVHTHHKRKHEYRINDSLNCIATGILSFFVGLYSAGFKGYTYLLVFHYLRLTDMHFMSAPFQITCVISLVVIQDCAYYWFHRAAHRINFMWAGHVVHHSSEEYNLTVAVRQSTFQQFTSWPFYLPLALIGYPPEWFVTTMSLNLIYQFWIHTREVDKMPAWFEVIFNTPSHHRVHHGTNKQYLDKNYGGILIIWDKLFGTFEAEHETVRYGITVPVNSFNPIWVNIHYYWYLWQTSSAAPSFSQALRLWLEPPDWKPDWIEICP